jgi:hypothetical protein
MVPGMHVYGSRSWRWQTLWLWGFLVFVVFSLAPGMESNGAEPFSFPIEGERAQVTHVRGEVHRQVVAEGPWSAVTLGIFVKAGERLRTRKDARLELQLPDRSVIRFDEESDIQLTKASYVPAEGVRDVQVSLLLGKTWANIQQAFGSSKGVKVESENAVVGVRGTVFRMNVAEDKSAMIKVYRGSVEVRKPHRVAGPTEVGSQVQRVPGPTRVAGPHRVTMEEWVRIVEAMQQVTVSAQGVPSDPRTFTMQEDLNDWVQWNMDRDRQL